MYSVAKAMTWEFIRRGWWWILAATLAIVGMVALRSCVLSLVGRSVEEWARDPEGRYLIFPIGFAASTLAVFPSLFEAPRGFSHRLYTKPVPTWFLVGWKMSLGMIAVTLTGLVSISLCNWLVRADLSLFGPSVFFATGLAVAAAGMWSLLGFCFWRIATWATGAVSLITWFSGVYWDGGLWSHPTRGELLTMGVFVVAAYAFAVVSVASDRCGNTRPWPDLQQIYDRVVGFLSMRRDDFRSALAAQFWAEWRPRGLIVPGIAAVIIAIPTIIILAGRVAANDAFETMLGGALLMGPVFAGIFVGGLIGNRQGGKDSFAAFVATRPLSDPQLAFVVLRAATTSIVAVWLVLVTGALASILGSAALGHHSAELDALTQKLATLPVFYASLALVGSLWLSYTFCSWTATLMLTGRQWLFGVANLLFWGGAIVAFILANFRLVPRAALPFVQPLVFCAGIAVMLVSTYAFVSARQRRFIGQKTIAISVGTWLLLCAIVAVAMWPWTPISAIVLMCGMLALSVAPVAAAPLALAWNRHR
jgi:hypothetical protein